MANYRTHAAGGIVSAGGVVIGAAYFGVIPKVEPTIIAVFFGFLGGLVPDLDHDTGRPLRIIGALFTTLVPILLLAYWLDGGGKWISLSLKLVIPLHYLLHWAFSLFPFWRAYSATPFGSAVQAVICSALTSLVALLFWGPNNFWHLWEIAILIAVGFQLLIPIFKIATVHRGCFHSIPTAFIFAELVFLYTYTFPLSLRLLFSISALAGALSHLILDELYSIDFEGKKIRLKRSWGTAFKFWEPNYPITSAIFWSAALIGAFFSLSTLPSLKIF